MTDLQILALFALIGVAVLMLAAINDNLRKIVKLLKPGERK